MTFSRISFHMIIFKPPESIISNSSKFGNYRKYIFCTRIRSGVIRIPIDIIILTLKEQVNQVNVKL